VAIVGFGAGALLGVAATYRYLSVKRRDGRSLAVIPTAGSATGVALLGRF
jgi:hypothetical protein